jgi:hypothetical protein
MFLFTMGRNRVRERLCERESETHFKMIHASIANYYYSDGHNNLFAICKAKPVI